MQEKKTSRRKRRTPEEAKEAILVAAEKCFMDKGPEGIRLTVIAKDLGMSHGTILYHYKSVEILRSALYQRLSLRVREEVLDGIDKTPGEHSLIAVFNQALERMSSPERGPLLSWLLSRGEDPFPEVQEKGLLQIAQVLSQRTGVTDERSRDLILLPVLAMFGECLVGHHVRPRLGVGVDQYSRDAFRHWLLQVIAREVAQETASPE